MSGLTWKQFKDAVDAELAKRGISEDTPIRYFDFSHPTNLNGVGMDGVEFGIEQGGIYAYN